MSTKLFLSAILKFTLGVALIGALLFLSMPLVLGSALAFVVFLAYPAIIIKRIRNEEDVLTRDLPGYAEYMQQVKWRLIPFVW